MKAGKPERARAALERIGSADYADRILHDIAHTLEKDNHKVSYGALLAPQVKTDRYHWHGSRHFPAVVWN
ncbi:putative general substrate transporter [Klebsiella oxytoca]|nr:putative general substrate transporter [Klebsiella oxytoca]